MDYWRAAMKMKSAISCVQNYGAFEGDQHEFVTDETYGTLVTKWRAVWACLMLTPAPNGRELNWKRDQIKGKKWKYNGLSAERIERAIADDVEWLEAHPVARASATLEFWARAMRALNTKDVLSDLFGSGDFPAEIIDPEHAAEIVIQRLLDAGFKIESAGN
jgi:hypothetical protein